MGYELHITRSPTLDEENTISREEWDSYIEAAPDFDTTEILSAGVEGTDTVISIPGDGIGLWVDKAGSREVPFSYWRGAISVKSPDKPIIERMAEVAASFDAYVVGDEGEIYYPESEKPSGLGSPLNAILRFIRGGR
ncbi:MAG: hypothetical protein IMF08_02280 [Proteobacteria bacterium]|nr:hypothetical protein [Pseudomonadota bacterium]MCK4867876.1 hypothetical protein [Alphaproteobacteria bacterium]